MGLLGDMNDPSTLATLQLAGGLLSPGSFGQGLGRGLQGYQSSLANSQDLGIKQQNLEMAKLRMAMEMRKMQWAMGDDTPQAAAPNAAMPPASMPQSVMFSPEENARRAQLTQTPIPGQPTQAVQGASPSTQTNRWGGLPDNIRRADFVFNDGKEIPKMMLDMTTPTSLRPGGYASYKDGRMVQLPQVPEGFTSIQQPDGSFRIVKVQGGPEAVAATSEAKASGPAGFHQTEIIGPDNKPFKVFNKDLPGFASPVLGTTPTAPGRGEMLTPTVDSLNEQILQVKTNGGQPIAPKDQPAIDRQVARITAERDALLARGGGSQLPRGAIQTGLAPGVDAAAKNAQETMTGSYKTVMSANQPAQTVQARLDTISSLAQKAITGGNTEWRDYANNLLQVAGVSDRALDRKTAGDLLDKNAAQISLAIGTGTQGTDALRALASAANPNRHMTPQAINEAVEQLKASAQVQQAKAQLLTPHYNAQNPASYNAAEQAFDKNADYRLWQISAATKGMNPDQIVQYFKAHNFTPSQVQQFKAQRQALQQLGVNP